MALSDLNTRIEAATVQLETDVNTVTSKVGSLTQAVTTSQNAEANATAAASTATGAATTASTDANRAEAALAAIDTKGYIGDAPKDDNQYARKNGSWAVVSGGGAGGGDVASVNGKTGVVVLTAADVQALPSTTHLFSGNYADLAGKPTLFSGAYADLTGKPTLSTVAGTGSYTDLLNRPTIIAEAPSDGNQYARRNGSWSVVEGGSASLTDPTIVGVVSLKGAAGDADVATLKGTSDSFEIAIPPTFVGYPSEAVLAYRPNAQKWVISSNGGTEVALATVNDVNAGITSIPTPIPVNNTAYPTGVKLRFRGVSATEIGLDSLNSSNTLLGSLTYSASTGKWMLKHTSAATASPVATEQYVTDAVAAGSGGSSAGGATLGRVNGYSTNNQRLNVVNSIIPQAENTAGTTQTWASAVAALSAYGLSSGGAFIFSNAALTIQEQSSIAYTYPLTSGGSTKATAATHRLEVFVNKNTDGTTVNAIDFIWWNLTDGTKHYKQCTSSNFGSVNAWKAIP